MIQNRIGLLRKENGLNQLELGELLGVGQTTVSAWENGTNEPSMRLWHEMSVLFGVTISYLAGY